MGIVDSVIGGIQKGFSFLADAIGNKILEALNNFIGMLLYYLTKAFMWFVWLLQQLFDVFAGVTKVEYKGQMKYLIDVFFENESINNVYWTIAMLGMVFVVAFTIIAVIRKTFDVDDQQKQSYGQILTAMFKSIFVMLVLSIAMNAAISLVNVTINQISYIFDNADSFSKEKEITFTDEQYATMARVYKTIGNYSLNPSYQSRYNLNSCYNDIRSDLELLEQQGVFDLTYITTENGKEINTWQSKLQELVHSTDTSRDVKLDKYYEEVATPLLNIMEILRTDASFKPLSYYKNGYTVSNSVGMDKILFLSGTVSAAKNPKYNQNPFLTDGLRGAFYTGAKDIYDFDDVKGAFDIGITGINYIFIWVLTYFTVRSLMRVIFSCIMRIFTMVSLYVVAPLTIASTPIDGGEKFKQWTTAMLVQSLSILGNIIPMRLILLFAPIVLSNDLVLFESVSLNFISKILLVVGGLEAVEGFSGIVKGILTNNAGMQALRQNDAGAAMGDKAFGRTMSITKSAAKLGAKGTGYAVLGAGIAALGAGAVGLGATALGVAGVGAGLYQTGRGIAKGVNYLRHRFGSKDQGAPDLATSAEGALDSTGNADAISNLGGTGGNDDGGSGGNDGGNTGGSTLGGNGPSGGSDPSNLSGKSDNANTMDPQKKEQAMQSLFGKDYKQYMAKEKSMQSLFGKDYKDYMKKKGLTQTPPQNLSGK